MADSNENWKKDEEEEEDNIDESSYIYQKDAILFAIDVSSSMLAPPPASDDRKAPTDSPTTAALKCAYQIMQQRIISSPKDMMGVLLFGTEESKFQEEDGSTRGTNPYPHCYLLSDLNVPAAEDVKALKAMVDGDEESTAILAPTDEDVAMSNLLFCANQIFTTRAPNFGSRRLFIITDNDGPHASNKQAAITRAKDLFDLGVVIELFPISHPDHDFDRTKFYNDIIYSDPAEGNDLAIGPTKLSSSGGGISLLSSLISDINSKQVAKRTLFSNMPFEIGPGFKISVKGYNLLQRQAPARSCYLWMDGETPQIVAGSTSKQNAESGREVDKTELKKAYKFGKDSQVYFTPEEQKVLKSFGPPGLRIIGFKPQDMLPFWASVNKSTFIYPSEDDYIGSTRVFSALWQKLLKDKKMGIAWYIARTNAKPTMVAILPSQERFEEGTTTQVIPAGLWLYQIPFIDDVRSLPELPKPIIAPDTLVDEMRTVVQQLQLPKAIYDPKKYPNPSLQWHYRILQAIALDEEVPETPDDKTIPKYRQINNRAGEYINNWGRILAEQHLATTAVKRESDHQAGPPTKRAKVKGQSQSLEDMGIEDLKHAAAAETLSKHTVADLKNFLISKGLSGTGKKGDLLNRVEQWMEDQ